ncbi:MAG: hypothetical protein ACFBSF_17400 [Leptolyngbyaceae cyanobacterium]
MKSTVLLPTLALTALIAACSGTNSSTPDETTPGTTTEAQTVPTTEAAEAVIASETPVSVEWKLCVPEGTFPRSTTPRNTDANGCRHNTKPLKAWPQADGTVEVLWVRKRAAAFGRQSTKPYFLVTRSRGCDPNGPGEEGHYEADESAFIDAEWANDRPIITVEDVTLSPIDDAAELENPEIGIELFAGIDCEPIDLENDNY